MYLKEKKEISSAGLHITTSKGRTFLQSNLNNKLNESHSDLDDEDSPGMDAEETTPVSSRKGNLPRLPTRESAPHMLQNARTEVTRGKY